MKTENSKNFFSIHEKWSETILNRDNRTCVCCGEKDEELFAVPILQVSDLKLWEHPEKQTLSLCKECTRMAIKDAFMYNNELAEMLMNITNRPSFYTLGELRLLKIKLSVPGRGDQEILTQALKHILFPF